MTDLFVPDHKALVLVVGDVILDRYVYGNTTRISPEAPVPIVQVSETEERPGGAGNVALNIRHLGVNVCLVGITGNDASADLLNDTLAAAGVDCKFARQDGFPTITKFRVLSQHQQLLRLDYEISSDLVNTDGIDELFSRNCEQVNIIVLSDYAKGSLKNITSLIQKARNAGKQVLVDPKGNDFERYKGANIITPNTKEFEAVVGDCKSSEQFNTKGINLLESLSLEALLVTQGEAGMTLFQQDVAPVKLSAESHEVFDVTGAGDTVIATLAAGLASGHNLVDATAMANISAGIVVEKLGAATVTIAELNNKLSNKDNEKPVVIDEKSLRSILDKIRANGKRIVMTNGCFDILHAGHVKYLNQAKALGDCLIVAVNDDASVKKLKGENRPVNKLNDRLSVLAGLESVDYLVTFSEDTPARLITEIKPDILVKGGDYQPEEIAGADVVKKNGGEVRIIPFIEGCSTSNIIDKLP